MFIHVVLFEIAPAQVAAYRADSRMWARYAGRAGGFVCYHTMKRHGYKNQYASVYQWRRKTDHDRFMAQYHDFLVGKSKARVKVEGYYNMRGLDRVPHEKYKYI